ncbi:MAG: dihydroorotate dehydrogenase-like protein [Bacteroidales bacterium]|nr:dihydroorotate dehydrogenase-like protein [Bacteroidales bacterium]
MSTINVNFAGLELKSPIIVGSCSQTASLAKIQEFEKAGAGAVVLKSLFEESITREVAAHGSTLDEHPEAYDYISSYLSDKVVSDYLSLIREAKSKSSIPIIASIACHTDGKWEEFATQIEAAGADALELNVMSLCTRKSYTLGDFERTHEAIVSNVSSKIKIPLIVKIGSNISNPVALVDSLYARGAKAVVLFNRFYPTDIDIDKMSFTMSNSFTSSSDLSQSIRWAGIISASVPQIPVAVSGGVEGWTEVVKSILSGATAVEVVSSIMKNGPEWITRTNEALSAWQKEKGYEAINSYKGKMNASDPEHADRLMRTQFLKYFSEIH